MVVLVVALVTLIGIVTLFTMPSMTAVHENMHEKAAKQKRERQIRNDMLPVVDKNINTGNRDKPDEYPTRILSHKNMFLLNSANDLFQFFFHLSCDVVERRIIHHSHCHGG